MPEQKSDVFFEQAALGTPRALARDPALAAAETIIVRWDRRDRWTRVNGLSPGLNGPYTHDFVADAIAELERRHAARRGANKALPAEAPVLRAGVALAHVAHNPFPPRKGGRIRPW